MSDVYRKQIEQFYQQIEDALLLAKYAIESGRDVNEGTITTLNEALESISSAQENIGQVSKTEFELSYRELASALAPVTAATLKATDDRFGREFPLWGRTKRSEAKIWSRWLWLYAAILAIAIISAENYTEILYEFYSRDEQTKNFFPYALSIVFDNLVPFFYGALGAIAFLLRTAHQFLHKRTFDRNRIPEYHNRIFLGLIAGGSIKLFVNQIVTDSGVVEISASALAFLAGYQIDFLFTTIERIIAAILPKVGLDSVKRQPLKTSGPTVSGTSIKELVDLLEKAKSDSAKESIKALIDKVKQRL